MSLTPTQTIVAIATPPGNGGVGVLRISGSNVEEIAIAVLGKLPTPRHATFSSFKDKDGSSIDQGIALYFPAPHSYTGEHVLELQAHGGRVVLDLLLQRILQFDAKVAQAGEFTQRAYLNGKLDLAQAEAVADLINSSTAQAVRSAQRSLSGEFSNNIQQLVDQVIELRCQVESCIDFSDEEIDFISELGVANRLQTIQEKITRILVSSKQGALLRDGITLVLAGEPNAGKSTLLNRMAGEEVAIVTDIPGTTRDLLKERIQLDGIPLHIIDTAGLRDSDDPVEQEGIRRAKQSLTTADFILLLIDARQKDSKALSHLSGIADIPVIRLYNKADLSAQQPRMVEDKQQTSIYLSAKTGAGMDILYQHLKQRIGFESAEDLFLARRRHLQALETAQRALKNAIATLNSSAIELLAEELRQVQTELSSITGEFVADDLLGEIFSRFCIGK